MKLVASMLLLLSSISLLSGCGGGASSGPETPSAKVVVSTAGTASALYGVQFTLQLPAGVTLAADGGTLPPGVMVPSGGAVGGSVAAYYDAAAVPQTVTVSVTKGTPGFPVGECVTFTPVLPEGKTPSAGDFVLSDFKAYDDLATGGASPYVTGEVTATR